MTPYRFAPHRPRMRPRHQSPPGGRRRGQPARRLVGWRLSALTIALLGCWAALSGSAFADAPPASAETGPPTPRPASAAHPTPESTAASPTTPNSQEASEASQEGSQPDRAPNKRSPRLLSVGDPVFVRYRFSPPAPITDNTFETDMTVHDLDVVGLIPLWRSESGVLIATRLAYKLVQLRFDPDTAAGGETLHRSVLGLSTLLPVSERWVIAVNGSLVVAGDYETFDTRLFQPLLGAIANWIITKRWIFAFGVAFSDTYFARTPYPLLGATYLPTEGVDLDLLLPARLRVGWWILPRRLQLMVVSDLSGRVWQVSDERIPDGTQTRLLQLLNEVVGRWRFAGPLALEVGGGVSYRLLTVKTDPDTEALEAVQPLAGIVRAGLVIIP